MSEASKLIRAGEVQIFRRSGLEWAPAADAALADLLDAVNAQVAAGNGDYAIDIVYRARALEAAITRTGGTS